MTTREKPILVGNDFYNYAELCQLIKEYPIVMPGWKVDVNKTHMYLVHIDELGQTNPLKSKRDPWNRPIRPWIYYGDDNPSIWQERNDQHPSRNAMFMPTAPTQATHMAYTSINDKWVFLYV